MARRSWNQQLPAAGDTRPRPRHPRGRNLADPPARTTAPHLGEVQASPAHCPSIPASTQLACHQHLHDQGVATTIESALRSGIGMMRQSSPMGWPAFTHPQSHLQAPRGSSAGIRFAVRQPTIRRGEHVSDERRETRSTTFTSAASSIAAAIPLVALARAPSDPTVTQVCEQDNRHCRSSNEALSHRMPCPTPKGWHFLAHISPMSLMANWTHRTSPTACQPASSRWGIRRRHGGSIGFR